MVEPIQTPESFDEWEWIKIRFRYPWMELLVIKKRVQYPQQNDFISIFSLFYLFFFLSNHYKTKAKPFCYLSNMILFTYTFPFFRGLNFYVSVSIWVGLAWGWLEWGVWKNQFSIFNGTVYWNRKSILKSFYEFIKALAFPRRISFYSWGVICYRIFRSQVSLATMSYFWYVQMVII